MRIRICAAAIVLAILLGCDNSWAQNASRLGVKISLGGSIFTSDAELTTRSYIAIDDTPYIFDSSNQMQYQFDPGIGKSVYGALCYKASKIVELEFGFGYSSMPMEISQVSDYSFSGNTQYIHDSYEYRKEKDADFRYMNFRPSINLILPTNSNVAPYFSVGLNILTAKASGTLTFAVPYVTEDATYSYLWIGPDAYLEPLEIDGSQTTFALDLGAGLEFEVNPTLSIDIRGAYLLQLQSVFEDFDEIIEDPDWQDAFRYIGYDFDGLNYSNFSFSIGMKLHFQ